MTWFETLTGFEERSPGQVRKNIVMDGETLTSSINGKRMACGRLETPTLAELRERIRSAERSGGVLSVREVVADVQELHVDTSNAGSLFQVASQFNLLEMASPRATPELGVGIYEYDHTQGPACAMAAGAGTIYRNYFVPVHGQIGQSDTVCGTEDVVLTHLLRLEGRKIPSREVIFITCLSDGIPLKWRWFSPPGLN